jgi:deferrochelatase/peroxidase EfeB
LQIKACGFLSAIDSFKELAFQRLLQRIADISNQTTEIKWGTVKYLAVIDTGFKFKDGVVNPATGYEGDRCVLAIR